MLPLPSGRRPSSIPSTLSRPNNRNNQSYHSIQAKYWDQPIIFLQPGSKIGITNYITPSRPNTGTNKSYHSIQAKYWDQPIIFLHPGQILGPANPITPSRPNNRNNQSYHSIQNTLPLLKLDKLRLKGAYRSSVDQMCFMGTIVRGVSIRYINVQATV